MNRKHFITVSLLLSALAFNPLIANELYLDHTSSQRQINTISSQIASLLYNRGLDEDVAYELSEGLIEDNELFETMINNLLSHHQDLTEDVLFEYLSTAALHRQSIDLTSYDHLVHMLTNIKSKALTEDELKAVNNISKLNQMLV